MMANPADDLAIGDKRRAGTADLRASMMNGRIGHIVHSSQLA